MIALTFNVSIAANSQTISFSGKNVTAKKMLSVIKEQTSYVFFYDVTLLKNVKPVSINVTNASIEKVLQETFKESPVTWIVQGQTISLISKAETKVEKTISAPVIRKISGVITDSKGIPLPLVNVVEKGSANGVQTDLDGKFSLTLSKDNAILVVSYIGFVTQEVQVGDKTTISITLIEDASKLDEVVVVGYGTVKKSDVTGSVSSISRRDLGDLQGKGIVSLIQGRVSGVDVVEGKIRIRGVTTLNSTDPLTVIDGFPGGNFNSVNPNDIESIEILKDASSTAIYGSRGANGVILITTKSGQVGKLKTSINVFTGIKVVPRYLGVLNAIQYNDYVKDALTNSNQPISDKLLSDYVLVDRTDWQKEMFRTANVSEVAINFSGGSENATHFTGIGFKTDEEIVQRPSSKNFYFKNKIDFKLSKWLKLGTNVAVNFTNNKNQWDAQQNYETMVNTINFPTYFPVYDESVKGGYSTTVRDEDLSDAQNPLTSVMNTHSEQTSLNYQGQLFIKIEPLKDLVLTTMGGVNGSFARSFTWTDEYAAAGGIFLPNSLKEGSSYGFSPLIENYLSYSKVFGAHTLKGMVGNSWQNDVVYGGIDISGSNFTSSTIQNVNVAPLVPRPTQWKMIDARLAYFGRFDYNYNSKYLATFNFRADASPNFSPENRWGKFPSVALAWKINEEDFMKSQSMLSLLKLRLGWGKSGNDAIGQYRYQSLVWNTGIGYPLGTSQDFGAGATIRDNFAPDIKWETTESKTIGLDFGLLKNRLTGTVEVFLKETSDILFNVPRPWSMGYGSVWTSGDAIVNAADVENKGFEFQLAYKDQINKFKYSVNGNYTFVHNEVTSLGSGQPYLDSNGVSKTEVGYPIGYFYGYVADGVFTTQKQLNDANAAAQAKGSAYYQEAGTTAGDVRFKDVNGDGKITPDDRTMIGNPIPKHMFGLNMDAWYKGFDVNFYWQGVAGGDIFDASYGRTGAGAIIRNQRINVLDRWRSEAEPGNGTQPRATSGDPSQNTRPSTLMVENGSYLKLRQFSLGYSLDGNFLKSTGIERVRFYVSGNNLFAITKYSGYDPEVGGENLSRGVLWLKPPVSRQFMMGLNLQF